MAKVLSAGKWSMSGNPAEALFHDGKANNYLKPGNDPRCIEEVVLMCGLGIMNSSRSKPKGTEHKLDSIFGLLPVHTYSVTNAVTES